LLTAATWRWSNNYERRCTELCYVSPRDYDIFQTREGINRSDVYWKS
jgi:hypothetical protein